MKKHVWAHDENREIDLHVLDIDGEPGGTGHNGPGCIVCGFRFCRHCENALENWESNCPKEW